MVPCDVDDLSDRVKDCKIDNFMIDYEDYGCNSGDYPSHNSADDPSHYSGFERALAIFSEIVLHFLVGAFFLIVEKTYMFVDLPISIDNIKII